MLQDPLHPNWVGLGGSSAPDVRSIVLKWGTNTYHALSHGVEVTAAMSDKRTAAVAVKRKNILLNTESYILQLLFHQIAFVHWGGFLNNAIG